MNQLFCFGNSIVNHVHQKTTMERKIIQFLFLYIALLFLFLAILKTLVFQASDIDFIVIEY